MRHPTDVVPMSESPIDDICRGRGYGSRELHSAADFEAGIVAASCGLKAASCGYKAASCGHKAASCGCKPASWGRKAAVSGYKPDMAADTAAL